MTNPIASIGQHSGVLFEGLPVSGLAYLLARDAPTEPLLVVAPDDERAEQLAQDLRSFGMSDVLTFPGEAHLPFEEVSPDPHAVYERLSLRHRMLAGERPRALVTSAGALQGRWLPDQAFLAAVELWVSGQELPRERLIQHLVRCGYLRVNLVEDVGTFAVRGGIIDLFSPAYSRPVRLDLFGDELASVKLFDPDSQRTEATLEAVAIHPIREVIFDPANVAHARERLLAVGDATNLPTRRLHSLVEEIEQRNYFYGVEALWPAFYPTSNSVLSALLTREVVLAIDDEAAVERQLHERWQRAEEERERAIERHRLALAVEDHLVPAADVLAALGAARIRTTRLSTAGGATETQLRDWQELAREMEARRADTTRGEILDPLIETLRREKDRQHEVFLACGSRGSAERLRELLRARKWDLAVLDALPAAATLGAKLVTPSRRAPRFSIAIAPLSGGLQDAGRGVAILTDTEIFGAPKRASSKRKTPAEGLATLKSLADGDLVVHADHGIGRYNGLRRLQLDGVDGDYVHLEYAGGDRLYLPVFRLKLLQRYRGPTDGVRLDKLGATRWLRAKQRVKDAVLEMAHGLLAVQARRKVLHGLALSPPDEHFRAFEATFAFEETPDQQRAIDDVLGDLIQDKPMDRLVCGDVGFGKTEVAIRAAYLAVLSGKQVAVLVPTTVLAEQHGITFRERLKGEPVAIEALSRFRAAADAKEIARRCKDGTLDIVIGTHRLLSGDVAFKNLGLLIVDEEHRFGVRQKERLKQMRSEVHVLTLSATPIPRTMHMSMTGLRDLSIIQTPPAERMSIRTEVTRFDDTVIREAIERELHRGGQVFVVHNRVHSIETMANFIRRLVPEARLAVAHGQMSAEKLERIMIDFVRREYNVLVCTAIIESGIDIPSANTMIVHRADSFGLAQLYQLRGRIGRGRERAHAYLLLPRSARIGGEATERLAVLKRFSDLGAGFQIATHDLDLRGAGDLLGADQSGHIAAVGFELYTELLAEAVEQVKGKAAPAEFEPEIKVPVSAVLPETYIPDPMQRLALYQRMAEAEADEAIFDVLAEVEDRYGAAPDEVRYLAEVMVIRRRLKRLGVQALSVASDAEAVKMGLGFVPQPHIDAVALAARAQAEPKRYRLLPSGKLMVTVAGAPATALELLRCVRDEIGVLEQPPAARG